MLEPRRHYCRNPRCRAKLAEPVETDRQAFCSPRCHAGFYRSHCLVCDDELPPGPANRKTCQRTRCRNEYRRRPDLFGVFAAAEPPPYPSAKTVERPPKTPMKSRGILPPETGRAPAWVVVAGPPLSPTAFRLATLPLDPETAARVKRANDPARIRRETAWGRAKQPEQIFGPDTPPLNVVGGYRFPDAPRIAEFLPRQVDRTATAETVNPDYSLCSSDPLEIPEFLRRQPRFGGSDESAVSPAIGGPRGEKSEKTGNELQLDLFAEREP
jgi:hypothetical protein